MPPQLNTERPPKKHTTPRKGGQLRALTQLTFACLTLISATAHADTTTSRNSWMNGLNEPFIIEWLNQQNVSCPTCPTNLQARPLNEIACRLGDLGGRRHMGIHKDMVTFYQLQPYADFDDPRNNANRLKILDIIKIYRDYNLSLVLAFGCPVPGWMSPRGIDGDWCPLVPPSSTSDTFFPLKDKVSWAIGHFVSWLRDNGIEENWIETHLYIDPWSEFDGVASATQCAAGPNAPRDCISANGFRAAELSGGVNYTLSYYGVRPIQSAVSIAGVCPGLDAGYPDAGSLGASYLRDYYDGGGGGLPDIHVYPAQPTVKNVDDYATTVNNVVPPQWKNRIIIGETGTGDIQGFCTPDAGSAMYASVRATYYSALATDPTLSSMTSALLFWRTLNYPAPSVRDNAPCEPYMGVTSLDDSAYLAVGNNLFTAVGGAPGDGSTEKCVGVWDAAEYQSQSVPTTVQHGQTISGTFTFKNTGKTTWLPGGTYKLSSQGHDANAWSVNRIGMPSSVAPGSTVTVPFSITAPSATGVYVFEWRMVNEGVQFFGDYTPAVSITVN